MKKDEVYLDTLMGRTVMAGNNRSIGRLEEFHAEQRGDYFYIVAFVIGSAGLMERLNLGMRTLFGWSRAAKIARWDQINLSDPTCPRLTCSVQELTDLET